MFDVVFGPLSSSVQQRGCISSKSEKLSARAKFRALNSGPLNLGPYILFPRLGWLGSMGPSWYVVSHQ